MSGKWVAVTSLRDSTASSEGGQLALQVENLACRFGGVKAVDGASFHVRQGHITGIIGPNGAGKSTAVNVICGNTAAHQGNVRLFGEEIRGMSPARIARLGLTRTFQKSSEFARLSVMENLLMGAPPTRGEWFFGALGPRSHWRQAERELVERARQLLGDFELEAHENSLAGELSGGQRRLVEIMRAIMGSPRMLVLDEPLAGVHGSNIARILRHIERLREIGVTTLIIEHDLAALEQVCDDVIIMSQGRVIGQGFLRELLTRPEVIDAYAMG